LRLGDWLQVEALPEQHVHTAQPWIAFSNQPDAAIHGLEFLPPDAKGKGMSQIMPPKIQNFCTLQRVAPCFCVDLK
jgi:hypothetical protein